MTANRLSALSAAFREVPLTCGPHKLRPMTAGSIDILKETGNEFFSDSAPSQNAGNSENSPESFQWLYEFIWIHTAPEDEVIAASENPSVLKAKAKKLSLSIGFDDLSEFSEKFRQLNHRLNAALVEIVPEKGMGKPGGEMPPTGLPPSSTPSVLAEIPTASTGCSGDCRFPEPSNTSTPPTTRPEPSPAGKSRIWEAEPEEEEDYAMPVTPLP